LFRVIYECFGNGFHKFFHPSLHNKSSSAENSPEHVQERYSTGLES
jgi:hypothetical protein